MLHRSGRKLIAAATLLLVGLSVSGCFYGPPGYYARPEYTYPAYAYRPVPYYGGGYGYGYGYRPHYW